MDKDDTDAMDDLRDERDRLRAQRDELLEALRGAVNDLMRFGGDDSGPIPASLDRARAAIAKAAPEPCTACGHTNYDEETGACESCR